MNIEELAFKDRKNLAQLTELDLLDIIEFLQFDRKQWINQFSKTHNESIDIQKENKKLKEIIKENTILVKDEYGNYQECNIKPLEMKQKYEKLKNNWNKLKEYLINDRNDRNGTKIAEFEDGNRVSETISPIYTLMGDKSKTMKEVLDKMQELEQGSDSNGNN